ncbi:MAG: hypothetical protein AAF411_06440 [Myxococcota bacterium]
MGGTTYVLPLDGLVSFNAPRCDPGEACVGELSWVRAEAIGTISAGGGTFSNIVFQNPIPITDAMITPVTGSLSSIDIPSDVEIAATADVSSANPTRRLIPFIATDPMTGSIDWVARTLSINGTFFDSSTGTTITLQLLGSFPNRTPQANAGPDVTVSCQGNGGANVLLDGSASFDPDDPQGGSDIEAYRWASTTGPNSMMTGPPMQTEGATASILAPVGFRYFSLSVEDSAGAISSDTLLVSVTDSSPPKFKANLIPLCIPEDNKLRIFDDVDLLPAFADFCDSDLSIEVTSITSVGDPPGGGTDIYNGANRFCIRGEENASFGFNERVYSVVADVSDSSGNTITRTITIEVANTKTEGCDRDFWNVPATTNALECFQ